MACYKLTRRGVSRSRRVGLAGWNAVYKRLVEYFGKHEAAAHARMCGLLVNALNLPGLDDPRALEEPFHSLQCFADGLCFLDQATVGQLSNIVAEQGERVADVHLWIWRAQFCRLAHSKRPDLNYR